MEKIKSIVGYLSRKDVKDIGQRFCNAFCMPALCIKPIGHARIKVRYTFEIIERLRSR
jgi:hypothetical protein